METSAKTAVSGAFSPLYTLYNLFRVCEHLQIIQCINDKPISCLQCHCVAKRERHILGNRQETAERRGRGSSGRRRNQVRGALKCGTSPYSKISECNIIRFS